MPGRVFASVFGNAAGQRAESRSPAKHTPFTIENIRPLDDNLRAAWHNDEFEIRNAYQLLEATVNRFRQILHDASEHRDGKSADEVRVLCQALFSSTLAGPRFKKVLTIVLFEVGARLLKIESIVRAFLVPLPIDDDEFKTSVRVLLQGLREVGLAGHYATGPVTRAMSELLQRILTENVGKPGGLLPGKGMDGIEYYVKNTFVPFAKEILIPLGILDNDPEEDQERSQSISGHLAASQDSGLVEAWNKRGKFLLAQGMAKQLYDIIAHGAVNDDTVAKDLTDITNSPIAREYVLKELERNLYPRLLNSGCSTVTILDGYVGFIFSLQRIDQSGVLLARIANDFSQYLRTRDDAVRIVILSLLEPDMAPNAQPVQSREYFSGHVSMLMARAIAAKSLFGTTYYPGKDLKNLQWVPEPIDAVADHTASRYRDAMGHMVTIKDKDAFIEELRSILGERLLKSDALKFDKEERLLAMFKTRFDDLPIRECEIMIKDMQESLTWHRYINGKLARIDPQAPDLEVKVISHTYWPTLKTDPLTLPPAMQALEDRYEKEFQEIKYLRKLGWLNFQGHVTVQLEFEDRTISEEVTTLQAAVIYQFETDDGAEASKSVDELQTALGLEEHDLLRAALTFWVGKLVLRESPDAEDTYTVIESLIDPSATTTENQQTAAAAAAAAATAAQEAATTVEETKTSADLFAENAELYTNFVVNMLTNQGHMPASRMMMMLKMLIPGGFPYEEVEFVEFLEGLASAGRVEKAGGLWMVKKA